MQKNSNKWMKMGLFLSTALLLSVTTSVNAYAAKNEVGYVNLQKVIIDSKQGIRLSRQLMKTKKNLASKAEDKQKLVRSLQEKLKQARQQKKPNEARISKLIVQIRAKNRDVKRFLANANEDISNLREDAVQEIMRRANKMIKNVAKKGGYSIIFTNGDAIAYLDKGVDITNKVVRAYNRNYK